MTRFTCTSCDFCERAERDPNSPFVHGYCRGCRIRGFAEGYPFWVSRRDKRLSEDYRQALERSFGDGWKAAHEEIKAEAERIHRQRAALRGCTAMSVAGRINALREKLKEGA